MKDTMEWKGRILETNQDVICAVEGLASQEEAIAFWTDHHKIQAGVGNTTEMADIAAAMVIAKARSSNKTMQHAWFAAFKASVPAHPEASPRNPVDEAKFQTPLIEVSEDFKCDIWDIDGNAIATSVIGMMNATRDGEDVEEAQAESRQWAQRIVACVNACREWKNPASEIDKLRKLAAK